MGVKFKQYGGASRLITQFTDTFTRADKDTLGYPWIRLLVTTPGAGTSATAFASVSSNNAAFISSSGAAPAVNHNPMWTPVTLYPALVSAAGVFVQYTFQSAAGASSGAVLRYNTELNNTETQAEGADYYEMIFNGRIDKRLGGGAQTTIGASTWAAVAGDVCRFECMTNTAGTAVTLQTIRNGAILQTVVDSTTPILVGTAGIIMNSISANGQTLVIRDFACGRLSALST